MGLTYLFEQWAGEKERSQSAFPVRGFDWVIKAGTVSLKKSKPSRWMMSYPIFCCGRHSFGLRDPKARAVASAKQIECSSRRWDTTKRYVPRFEAASKRSYGPIDDGCIAWKVFSSPCIKNACPLPMYSQLYFSRYLISHKLHCPIQTDSLKTCANMYTSTQNLESRYRKHYPSPI